MKYDKRSGLEDDSRCTAVWQAECACRTIPTVPAWYLFACTHDQMQAVMNNVIQAGP